MQSKFKKEECSACKGDGIQILFSGEKITCKVCKGDGKIRRKNRNISNGEEFIK